MTPTFTSENVRDCHSLDSVEFANLAMKHFPLKFANFSDFNCRKYSHPDVPPFSGHVRVVFGASSEPEMIRIATIGDVSGWTIVENARTARNRSIMNDPREAMCKSSFCWPLTGLLRDLAVSLFVFVSSPKPAGIGFVDVRPKAFYDRLGISLRDQVVECIRSLHQSVRLIVCHAFGSSNREGISFLALQSEGGNL